MFAALNASGVEYVVSRNWEAGIAHTARSRFTPAQALIAARRSPPGPPPDTLA